MGLVCRFWRPFGDLSTKTVLRKADVLPSFCAISPKIPGDVSLRREDNRETPTHKLLRQGTTACSFFLKTPKFPFLLVLLPKNN